MYLLIYVLIYLLFIIYLLIIYLLIFYVFIFLKHRYGSVPIDAYRDAGRNRPQIQSTIEESRKCHFSLGLDKVKYMSNTHSALKLIEGHEASDVSKSAENAKAMKVALQKTSIVIGDDNEYM